MISTIIDPHTFKTDFNTVLKSNEVDWDKLVTIGSKNLIIPTLYYSLKQKGSLQSIPLELKNYLEDISNLNKERNQNIINQLTYVSKIFHANNIEYVFLKGAAMLVSGFYSDIGARMLGDIDILVHPDQVSFSYEILLKNGFIKAKESAGNIALNPRHLTRLIPENDNFIGAIEIHHRILKKRARGLDVLDILNEKVLISGKYIPSVSHLLLHNIANWQINDRGFYYKSMGLRSIYDALVVLKNHPSLMQNEHLKKPPFKNYFEIHSFFFPSISKYSSKKLSFDKILYFLKVKSPIFRFIWTKSLVTYFNVKFFVYRFYYFLSIKKYRAEILKRKKSIRKG